MKDFRINGVNIRLSKVVNFAFFFVDRNVNLVNNCQRKRNQRPRLINAMQVGAETQEATLRVQINHQLMHRKGMVFIRQNHGEILYQGDLLSFLFIENKGDSNKEGVTGSENIFVSVFIDPQKELSHVVKRDNVKIHLVIEMEDAEIFFANDKKDNQILIISNVINWKRHSKEEVLSVSSINFEKARIIELPNKN